MILLKHSFLKSYILQNSLSQIIVVIKNININLKNLELYIKPNSNIKIPLLLAIKT